ncbi:MAG: hypothetical protein ACE5E6_04610, partial [Phycisphaerae bacterium]
PVGSRVFRHRGRRRLTDRVETARIVPMSRCVGLRPQYVLMIDVANDIATFEVKGRADPR